MICLNCRVKRTRLSTRNANEADCVIKYKKGIFTGSNGCGRPERVLCRRLVRGRAGKPQGWGVELCGCRCCTRTQ